jgi:pilus assembly protein Flp/PilA
MSNMFLMMIVKVREFASREEGQDLVEYALLAALIALAVVGGVGTVASALSKEFTTIAASV